MNHRPSHKPNFKEDADFSQLLKRHDPALHTPQSFLNLLERDILAKADDAVRVSWISLHHDVPLWGLVQKVTARVAAFAAVAIVALGFLVGHVIYGEDTTIVPVVAPSLLAFADEPVLLSVPASDTAWGDNNEDAQ